MTKKCYEHKENIIMNTNKDQENDFLDLDEKDTQKQTETPGSATPSPDGGKKGFKINMHFVLIAIIVLIAGISVYRLVRWNQGTTLEDDIEVDPSEFDVEKMDMIIPMDSSRLEGREDDGVTTILCLGNNPFSDDRSETGLAAKIAEKTDAVVYDCAFPNSSAAVTLKNGSTSLHRLLSFIP